MILLRVFDLPFFLSFHLGKNIEFFKMTAEIQILFMELF